MKTRHRRPLAALLLTSSLLALGGCAGTPRPVLYPNDHHRSVGEPQARRDVDQCMHLAKDFGAPVHDGTAVTRDAAAGAAIGGAASGAWAIVRGDAAAGNRALAGAAAGGAAGLVRGSLRAGAPSAIYKGFVDRCLDQRGYDVIGWQ